MLSNVTGTWLQPDEATDPSFWAAQITKPVRFAENVGVLATTEPNDWSFVEVGPGRTLATLVRQHEQIEPGASVVNCVRHPNEDRHDRAALLDAVGRLWTAGVSPE